MGLVIEGNLVKVDHAVKDLLITTAEGNPKVSTTECGLQVTSIFTRLKASAKVRRDRSSVGDNCHMLYALKQKDGLVTDFSSIRLLVESGRQILDSLTELIHVDTVVYMPSAYSVSAILGRRCADAFGAQLVKGVFRKTTKLEAYEMLSRAEANGDISRTDKRKLDFRIKQSDGQGFSLKEIPIKLRTIFIPLHLDPAFQGAINGSVVLVDDLLASGQTLSVAASLIRQMPEVTDVRAVCLFSSV